MNQGVREKELPEHFATGEYQVLLVAEKYQTGFDQPLLHTMYVDKRLAGIQAVQTLSRLNRIHPFKEDTFVLDFVNDRDEIREAFKTYYEGAEMGEEADPARMYAIREELDASGIYLGEEVERFCEIFFKPRQRQSPRDHQAMNAALDPAVSRFAALHGEREDEAELWRGKVQAFRNLYGFLSQVIPYQDSDLAGRSMEPAIPDGAYGLFRAPVRGTRQGKTVLVRLHDATDPETGARYTVKRYESEKAADGGSWRHARITLRPNNPEFEPIVLTGADEGEIAVVAELVEVVAVSSDGEEHGATVATPGEGGAGGDGRGIVRRPGTLAIP